MAIRGAVQGVGFRPFVFRLAGQFDLAGWVQNSVQGLFVEAEGRRERLEQFLLHLERDKPPRSFVQSLEASWLDPAGYVAFEIRPSDAQGDKTALVLPDIATCPDCLREIFDPRDRRYSYPFTNCTNCGPRFSIIRSLPYDRMNTSMREFTMCLRCRDEYEDPANRRFHAQPNACPDCGPRLELWDAKGTLLAAPTAPDRAGRDVLASVAEAIRSGRIVAVKGLGGFHLMTAAFNETALLRLRERKHREEKPFALMFPSLQSIRQVCEVVPLEERLIQSPEAPIVLLRRLPTARGRFQGAAPGNPNLGVMLPYTPLHHLLMSMVGAPVVATSGNVSDEPICTDEREAVERLGGLADLFLVHNRPIVRHVDDSILRVMAGRELVLRRARGFAPLPVRVSTLGAQAGAALAVGAHLKNTVALSVGPQVFLSQHIGDLETDQAFEAFRKVIADLERLYEVRPEVLAADLHPDYLSTKFAVDRASAPSELPAPGKVPRVRFVQHHVAHVLSCMAENELQPPVLGVSWDGTGYGPDQTVWGGEFFIVDHARCRRFAHLRTFRLPGGDQAVKEPRRSALGVLFETCGESAFGLEHAPVRAFTPAELTTLRTMLKQRLNSPLTSSAGRLFDAVASLTGLRHWVRFEGQAAMELEFACENASGSESYPIALLPAGEGEQLPAAAGSGLAEDTSVVDWAPLVAGILADLVRGCPIGEISRKFHNTLADAIVLVAHRAGLERVVLSGGCFQNRYLTESAIARLRQSGFRPYWHQRVPPNDGGIALGQVAAVARAACKV